MPARRRALRVLLVLLLIPGDPQLPPHRHRPSNAAASRLCTVPPVQRGPCGEPGPPRTDQAAGPTPGGKALAELAGPPAAPDQENLGGESLGEAPLPVLPPLLTPAWPDVGRHGSVPLRRTKNPSFEAAASTNQARCRTHCLKPQHGGCQTSLLSFQGRLLELN